MRTRTQSGTRLAGARIFLTSRWADSGRPSTTPVTSSTTRATERRSLMPEPGAPRNGGIRAPLRPSVNGHAKRPPALRTRRPTRIANIRMGLIAGTGVLVLLVIFIVQNAHTVHITFLGAHAMVSLAVALLLAAIAGALVMAAAGTTPITQLRRTAHRARRHTHVPASDTRRGRDTGPAGPASGPRR